MWRWVNMRNAQEFRGPFASYLNGFLAEKRALGFKYIEQERCLHEFDLLSLEYDCSCGLPKELVLAYIEKKPHWSRSTQQHKVSTASNIASYLQKHGVTAYLCDKANVAKDSRNFKPYIFTRQQMEDIFYQADNIVPRGNVNSNIFYPVILRMLYGCGLRISEALSLRMKDVDLSQGLLYIYDTKNHKDRVIPMDESLTSYCRKYAEHIHAVYTDDDYFFESPRGGQYAKHTVYYYFRDLIWKCGISHGGRQGGGPRLHDIRHTFCVHSLYQFLKNGIPHRAALPVLSAYMGHSSLDSTGRYLKLTAEAYPELTEQLERELGHIIPDLEVRLVEAD
jgi:integrase